MYNNTFRNGGANPTGSYVGRFHEFKIAVFNNVSIDAGVQYVGLPHGTAPWGFFRNYRYSPNWWRNCLQPDGTKGQGTCLDPKVGTDNIPDSDSPLIGTGHKVNLARDFHGRVRMDSATIGAFVPR